MDCPNCGNSNIRRSRLRLSDFPEPIIGRLPMRCRDCSDRFFVWLPQVLISKWLGQLKRGINAEWRKSSRTYSLTVDATENTDIGQSDIAASLACSMAISDLSSNDIKSSLAFKVDGAST
jgi:hypothetical protein